MQINPTRRMAMALRKRLDEELRKAEAKDRKCHKAKPRARHRKEHQG